MNSFLLVAVALFSVAHPSAEGSHGGVNACLAVDRSQAMGNGNVAEVRFGLMDAIRQLRPTDSISLVAYDDLVQVVVPATRLVQRDEVAAGIRRLDAGGGSTAAFAAVVKCKGELARFARPDRASRIVLVSAENSPAQLGTFATLLMKEGISLSTVVVGERTRNVGRLVERELLGAGLDVASQESAAGNQPSSPSSPVIRRGPRRVRRDREQARVTSTPPRMFNLVEMMNRIGNDPLGGLARD